jgi:hypothetical protein
MTYHRCHSQAETKQKKKKKKPKVQQSEIFVRSPLLEGEGRGGFVGWCTHGFGLVNGELLKVKANRVQEVWTRRRCCLLLLIVLLLFVHVRGWGGGRLRHAGRLD